MGRHKGSLNKTKSVTTTEVKRGAGRPRKDMTVVATNKPRGRPPGSTNKKSTSKVEEKSLPNINFEDNDELDYSNVKITELPYMGPDANDDERFISEQIISKRKWNDDDFGENFSISTDELY